jgi:hypothetical protein
MGGKDVGQAPGLNCMPQLTAAARAEAHRDFFHGQALAVLASPAPDADLASYLFAAAEGFARPTFRQRQEQLALAVADLPRAAATPVAIRWPDPGDR